MNDNGPHIRLDKWLWAARFFKTRSIAAEEVAHGRICVNQTVAKASREVRLDDLIGLRQAGLAREVRVLGLSGTRGPAPVAQALYQETPQSLARRDTWAQARRDGVEPALGQEHGRPTKRDRRQLVDWQRWSASADDATGEPTDRS